MEMNQNNLLDINSNKFCSQILTHLPKLLLAENNMQKIQNDIQSKIFEMSKTIEKSVELENKNNTFKNEISSIKNKIIATAIVQNNTDLYTKILGINKGSGRKTKEKNNPKY